MNNEHGSGSLGRLGQVCLMALSCWAAVNGSQSMPWPSRSVEPCAVSEDSQPRCRNMPLSSCKTFLSEKFECGCTPQDIFIGDDDIGLLSETQRID